MPERPNVLRTWRLHLYEASYEQLKELAAGGLPGGQFPAPGYPLEGTRVGAAMAALDHERGEYQPGFGMYQIRDEGSQLMIGDIGFHGPPRDGVVEVGYGVVAKSRGHGLMGEALAELLRWAISQPDVRRVRAVTDHDNAASQKLLIGAGFRLVDPDAPQLEFTYP